MFYHHNDYSPAFDKARSIRADSLFFNNDGTIRKVIPTLRGIGVTNAMSPIQIDRYSAKSEQGSSIAFLDTTNKFAGWKVVLEKPDAWIQYNNVKFEKAAKKVIIRANAAAGGTIVIRSGSLNGPVIAEITVPAGNDWKEIDKSVSKSLSGIQHLVMQLRNGKVETDWIKFE